jgi:hypothetical protein
MFETEQFKRQLTDTIVTEASRTSIKTYEIAIVDYLQKLATTNEQPLMEREMRKAAGERRGLLDALSSARELTREAVGLAIAERRTLLKVSDFEAAYRSRFCRVWPFCKS